MLEGGSQNLADFLSARFSIYRDLLSRSVSFRSATEQEHYIAVVYGSPDPLIEIGPLLDRASVPKVDASHGLVGLFTPLNYFNEGLVPGAGAEARAIDRKAVSARIANDRGNLGVTRVSFPMSNSGDVAIVGSTQFGRAAVGASVEKTFTIHNLGSSPLTITEAVSNDVAFRPGLPPTVIVAGGKLSFPIVFTPNVVGPIQGKFSLTSSGTGYTWTFLHGEGLAVPPVPPPATPNMIGKPKVARGNATLTGAFAPGTVVEYAIGKGKFKKAKVSGANWKITAKLQLGRNTISIRVVDLATGQKSSVKKVTVKR